MREKYYGTKVCSLKMNSMRVYSVKVYSVKRNSVRINLMRIYSLTVNVLDKIHSVKEYSSTCHLWMSICRNISDKRVIVDHFFGEIVYKKSTLRESTTRSNVGPRLVYWCTYIQISFFLHYNIQSLLRQAIRLIFRCIDQKVLYTHNIKLKNGNHFDNANILIRVCFV